MSQKSLLTILAISLVIILMLCFGVVSLLFLRANQGGSGQIPTLDPAVIASQVAETVIAEITQQAPAASATQTASLEPTATQTSTTFQTPTPTDEIVIPSVTPMSTAAVPTTTQIPPTMIVPTFTPKPVVCDRAQLVRDMSVADNSPLAPDTTIVKTWQLKNIGSCTWTTNYKLVFRSGDAMTANLSIPLPKSVAPDQTVDVSVTLKTPSKVGTYRGDWMLNNDSGTRFGIGPNGDQSFWVQIQVINLVNSDLVYDFAGHYCQADWSTREGRIPCPGTTSAAEGFVILSNAPRLENRQEDEWALLTHPNNSSRGWISGKYPNFEIRPNQHFTAWVGCLADSKGCNINFRLDFENLANGNIRNLGSWREVYDGDVTKIDLDLSEHAGKNVRFILTVEVSGGNPALANAFWFVPGIVQGQPPAATPTAVPPTEVPSETPTDSATPQP